MPACGYAQKRSAYTYTYTIPAVFDFFEIPSGGKNEEINHKQSSDAALAGDHTIVVTVKIEYKIGATKYYFDTDFNIIYKIQCTVTELTPFTAMPDTPTYYYNSAAKEAAVTHTFAASTMKNTNDVVCTHHTEVLTLDPTNSYSWLTLTGSVLTLDSAGSVKTAQKRFKVKTTIDNYGTPMSATTTGTFLAVLARRDCTTATMNSIVALPTGHEITSTKSSYVALPFLDAGDSVGTELCNKHEWSIMNSDCSATQVWAGTLAVKES